MKQQDEFTGEDGAVGPTPAAYRAPEGGRLDSQPLRLPPNTTLHKFQEYIAKIAQVVGDENVTVISSDAELQHEDYMDPSKAHDVRLQAPTP